LQFDDVNPFEAINARIAASFGADHGNSERPRSPRPVRKSSMRARALLEAVARVPGLVPGDAPREPTDAREPAGDASRAGGGGGGAGSEAADAAGSGWPRGCLVQSWLPKEGSRAGRLDFFRVPSIQQSP
jgi:hypothetical protein